MLTPPDQSSRKPLFDADAIAAELEELVPQHEGHKELRIAVAMRLKRALADARKAAEAVRKRSAWRSWQPAATGAA
jgi:hypothetical protein